MEVQSDVAYLKSLLHDVVKAFIVYGWDSFWGVARDYLALQGWRRLLEYRVVWIRPELDVGDAFADVVAISVREDNENVYAVTAIEVKTGRIDGEMLFHAVLRQVSGVYTNHVRLAHRYLANKLGIRSPTLSAVGYILVAWSRHREAIEKTFNKIRIATSKGNKTISINNKEYYIPYKLALGYIPLEPIYRKLREDLQKMIQLADSEAN